MDAIVLVGGQGTRLRPLTVDAPKPLLPLVDRPLLSYLLEQCAAAGVERVIFSCGYLSDAIKAHYGDRVDALGLTLEHAVEERALGTAGAIRFAASGRVTDTFLALNGDILSDIDLRALVERHREVGARATIALAPVDDPSRYGLVRTEADGAVREFVEKPSSDQIDTNLINAGVYVLEPSVLDRVVSGRAVSIEREVFPLLVGDGLYAFAQRGYWADIGTPESYLAAHHDVLDGAIRTRVLDRLGTSFLVIEDGATVEPGAQLVPPLFVGAGAHIETGARVGHGSTIAAGAVIGQRSVVERSVVQRGARVGAGCHVRGSIVGPGASIGDRTRLDGLAIVGPGVNVGADNVLRSGIKLFPGAGIADGVVQF